MSEGLPQLPGMSLLTELENLSDADPRDLGQAQVGVLRRLFETPDEGVGLFLFCKVIFGFKDLTLNIHLPICRLLSRWGETVFADGFITKEPPSDRHFKEHGEAVESYRRLMIIVPREHFKTSVCTRANPIWQLARDPLHNDTIGIFNEKAENAQAWVYSITQVIERSRLFQILWPEMLPRGISFADQEKGITRKRDVKWGAGGILFEREALGVPELSIEPHGIGGAVTGKHYTKKLLDDIIGKEAAYSPAVMKTAIDWLDNSRPLERPAENGLEAISCTPWAYADVYTHALEHWPGEYRVYRRHILENELGEPDAHTGTSIFPDKISTNKAKQLLKTDPYVNWAQYMCLPRAGRDQSFQQDWIKYGGVITRGQDPVWQILAEHYDPSILDLECGDETAPRVVPLSWMSKAIILDPAPGKPTELKKSPNAANGITVVGKDPWGRRYLLEARAERDTPNRIFEILYELSDKWLTNRIGIEEVNFSMVYAPLYTELGQYKYPEWRPEFHPLSTKGFEKFDRIKKKLITPMATGFWHFNTHGTALCMKELVEFPNGATIDVLDALSYTDDIVMRPESPDEKQQKFYRRFQASHDRGLTGYGVSMASESAR